MHPVSPGDSQTGAAGPSADTSLPAADSSPAARSPKLHDLPATNTQFEQEFQNVKRVGSFYAAMLLPILVAAGWGYHTRSNAVEIDFWASGAIWAVIAVYATVWRHDWWHLARLPSGCARRWLIAGCLAPLATIVAAELLHHWALTVGIPVQDILEGFGGDNYPTWLLALWMVVLAPVFEEVAFRGVMMAQLQRVMSPTQAIWVSASLFGVLHFSVLSIALFLVPLGAVAGYLTRETKSLLPAIAIHAAHNAGVLLLAL
jgi:membrane protease YdiL (CAAX protease family)